MKKRPYLRFLTLVGLIVINSLASNPQYFIEFLKPNLGTQGSADFFSRGEIHVFGQSPHNGNIELEVTKEYSLSEDAITRNGSSYGDQGISIVDKSEEQHVSSDLFGFSIYSEAAHNPIKVLVWSKLGGVTYQVRWASPPYELRKGLNRIHLPNPVKLEIGDTLGLWTKGNIPHCFKDYRKESDKIYVTGKQTLGTPLVRSAGDAFGSYCFMPLFEPDHNLLRIPYRANMPFHWQTSIDIPQFKSVNLNFKVANPAENFKIWLLESSEIRNFNLIRTLLFLLTCYVLTSFLTSLPRFVSILSVFGLFYAYDHDFFTFLVGSLPVLILIFYGAASVRMNRPYFRTLEITELIKSVRFLLMTCVTISILLILAKLAFLLQLSYALCLFLASLFFVSLLFCFATKPRFKSYLLQPRESSTYFLVICILYVICSSQTRFLHFDLDFFYFSALINQIKSHSSLKWGGFDPFLGQAFFPFGQYYRNGLILIYSLWSRIPSLGSLRLFSIISFWWPLTYGALVALMTRILNPQSSVAPALAFLLSILIKTITLIYGQPIYISAANPGEIAQLFFLVNFIGVWVYHNYRRRVPAILYANFFVIGAGIVCHAQYVEFFSSFCFFYLLCILILRAVGYQVRRHEVIYVVGSLIICMLGFGGYFFAGAPNLAPQLFKLGEIYHNTWAQYKGLFFLNIKALLGIEFWFHLLGIGIAWHVARTRKAWAPPLYTIVLGSLLGFAALLVPGAPNLFVKLLSEMGLMRINSGFQAIGIALAIAYLSHLAVSVQERMIGKVRVRLILFPTILVFFGIVFSLDLFTPFSTYPYVARSQSGRQKLIDFLAKPEFEHSTIVSDAMTSFWLGSELKQQKYAYVANRMRTVMSSQESHERADLVNIVGYHMEADSALLQVLAKVRNPLLLLDRGSSGGQIYRFSAFFENIYKDESWVIYRPKATAL